MMAFLGPQVAKGIKPPESPFQTVLNGPVRLMQPMKHDTFSRFGSFKKYTATDLQWLKPSDTQAPVVKAFKERFPQGSQLIAAAAQNTGVLIYDVLKNTGDTVTFKEAGGEDVYTVSLKDDLFLYQQTLLMNLSLINRESISLESLWREQFEAKVDQIQAFNKIHHRPIVMRLADVKNPEDICHPCGFTISGDLFMVRNPAFNLVGQPAIPPLRGHLNDVVEMASAVWSAGTPEDRIQEFGETPAPAREIQEDSVVLIPQHELMPIMCEGMYERAAFYRLPDKNQK